MLRTSFYLTLTLLLIASGCGSGRHSASGFRLPADGSVERGQTVFIDLKCHDCHQVSGVNLPQTPAERPLVVRLGGERYQEMTDGYLVTSIINPSERIMSRHADLRQKDGKSRMPEFGDSLTVRQLTDLVEFLQAHYTVRPAARDIPQL
jgi:sulfur-oxidizing protein SoxX